MKYLSNAGRIFFGVSIVVIGLATIYYKDFPYMLIPRSHSWIPGLVGLSIISGILLVIAGSCIVSEKKIIPASILLGSVLLFIFCFYFIPYQLMVSPNYMSFVDWEDSAKELALAAGAFVIAGSYPFKNENNVIRFLSKLIPLGRVLFSITIISFGIDHFIVAKQAADYVPSWVPFHLFWIYFCGVALLGSGLAILLNIKRELASTLLGAMIFTWFITLHVPRIIVSPVAYLGSEITSAFIALAYCGIALAIAGTSKSKLPTP